MGARKKVSWGGPRLGSGRPPGSGPGPSPDSRRHRVVVMLSSTDFKRLKAMAKRAEKPLGTLAFELFSREFRRAK